jgi:two-component system, NarL family, invasion response regulator UvrY
MSLRVIVVDDHAIVRRGIVEILTERSDLEVVSEAADYSQLRAQLRQHGDIDLLVMDLSLPGKDGIEILKLLHADNPRLKVLVVSMHPEEQYAVRAFKAGACGYLNKASAPEKLLEAVDQIVAGRKYVTPEIAQALIDQLAAPEDAMPHERLSDREFQVFKLMAAGRRLSEIASLLALSPKTVSVYRARILDKMNLQNNSELVHYAVKNGLA